ncbi:MAG: hypothetical protein AAF604_22850, partial [Acidobacteriota bacterium]
MRLRFALAALAFVACPTLITAAELAPAPFPPQDIPGTFVDRFDDGIVGPHYAPIGGATLIEQGGQLRVIQKAKGEGVLVKYPAQVAGQSLFVFCARVGFQLSQLGPGEMVAFEAVDVATGGFTTRSPQDSTRWEIEQDPTDPSKYNYKVYKNGSLTTEGQATIPENASGFRIDKVPGTNMVIGEVLFPDGSWEKLWEHDPPEIPFETFSITSTMDEFALDDVMGGLHTDDPNSDGAVSDLAPLAEADGGLAFYPRGDDLYDVEMTFEDLVAFSTEGESVIPLALEIGERSLAFEVKCRGGTGGTCSGQSNCSTKTCPDREYDIGDGNGYRTYSGTCKKATLGLPLCSCSYSLKKTVKAVKIAANQTVELVIDPKNSIPEIVEGNNRTAGRAAVEPFAMVTSHSCNTGSRKNGDGESMAMKTTISLSSGFFPAESIRSESLSLIAVNEDGMLTESLPLTGFRAAGGTAELTFADDGSMGIPGCPTELILLGVSDSPLRYWSTKLEAIALSPLYPTTVARSLIGQLEALTPDDPEVGTPQIVPNSVADQLIAMGDMAVPELIATLTTGSDGQKAFAAYILGEIGNSSAIPDLEDLRDQLEAQPLPWSELTYTQLSEIDDALTSLGLIPVTNDPQTPSDETCIDGICCVDGFCYPEERKRCCVSGVDAVTSGPFSGGKRAGDYYPEVSNPDGSSSRWSGDGSTAGPHNIGSPPAQRTGALVQIVGTMDGDRSCCTISQNFVIEKSNYDQDTADVGERVDDLGRSRRDVQNGPFRQQHGGNQDSFCDYPARQYNAPPGRLNYCRRQRFTSCYHSYPDSQPPCQWQKCCVTWKLEQTANGNNASTTVT